LQIYKLNLNNKQIFKKITFTLIYSQISYIGVPEYPLGKEIFNIDDILGAISSKPMFLYRVFLFIFQPYHTSGT